MKESSPARNRELPQQAENEKNVRAAAQRIVDEVLRKMQESLFFQSNLTITVQNGVVRTAKIGTEECTNFVAAKTA